MADTSTLVNTAMDALRPSVGIPNADALVEQRRSNTARIGELQKQADIAQKGIADVPAVQIPEFKAAPEAPVIKPFKMDGGTVMAFAAMAALGGLGTRQPLANAMNSLSAAIKGYNDGDQRMFDHAYKQFKIQNDTIMQQNDRMSKQLEAAMKGRDQTIEQRKATLDSTLKNIGSLKEDTKTIDEAFDKALEYSQKTGEYNMRMKELELKMQNLRADQALEPLKLKEQEAQTRKAILELEKAKKNQSGVPGYTDMEITTLDGQKRVVSQPAYGSPEFMTEASKHADQAGNLQSTAVGLGRLVGTMNRLVNRPEFTRVFGAKDSATLNFATYLTRIGASDAMNDLESIQDNMKSLGLAEIRKSGTPGAITEKEWPILQNQIAAIGPRTTADEALDAFKRVAEVANEAIKNQQYEYGSVWQYRPQFLKTDLLDPSLHSMEVKRVTPQERAGQQEQAGQQGAAPREPYADPEKEQRYQEWLKSRGLQ